MYISIYIYIYRVNDGGRPDFTPQETIRPKWGVLSLAASSVARGCIVLFYKALYSASGRIVAPRHDAPPE